MIAIDVGKQQPFDTDSKAIQQIDFTGYLTRGESVNGNTIIFFVTEEAK